MTEFTPFPKIPRATKVHVTITEKIDGTNAAVRIEGGDVVAVQSRTRLITPNDDNFGFAAWARYNETALVDLLGEGTHFGEWAGPGIQKNHHNLSDKTFFLFNSARWADADFSALPQLRVVPVLYTGEFGHGLVEQTLIQLEVTAEEAGYTPEGVICYWHEFRSYSKATFKTPQGKWAARQEAAQ